MKKKLCILVGGMYREFDLAYKSWTFLNHRDRDIFISTWDRTTEINDKMGINISENVTEERIKKRIKDAVIKVTPVSSFDLSLSNFDTTGSNFQKMVFHWKLLLNMVKESEYEYELILLTRPDFYMREVCNLNNFINNINDDIVYGLSFVNQTKLKPFIYVQDCLFISKFKIIEKLIDSIEEYTSASDVHDYLARYFINNNIYVDSLSPNILRYLILRSVHRNIEKCNIDELITIGDEWYLTKHYG